MEGENIKSLSGQLKALVEVNKDFSRKLKQRLESECSKVENQMKFIYELCNEGVLCEGSNDMVMLVQMAVTIGYSKGADGIGGLLKALERSGNSQLLSALQTWAEGDFQIETEDDGGLSEPQEGSSALKSPPRKKLQRNVTRPTELSSSGAKLMDKIMPQLDEDGFMQQFQAFFLSKVSQILHAKEFCLSLLHQSVLVESVTTGVPRQNTRSVPQRATGPRVQEGQNIVKAIKAACSKRAIKSLVLALQSSSNERILVEIYDWLEACQARKKKDPIPVTSLANRPIYLQEHDDEALSEDDDANNETEDDVGEEEQADGGSAFDYLTDPLFYIPDEY